MKFLNLEEREKLKDILIRYFTPLSMGRKYKLLAKSGLEEYCGLLLGEPEVVVNRLCDRLSKKYARGASSPRIHLIVFLDTFLEYIKAHSNLVREEEQKFIKDIIDKWEKYTPYRGLMPYSESDEDAFLFFGREREQEIITSNLMASRFTLLYGDSGVGKTSLLRAGVVYNLRKVAWQNWRRYGIPKFAVVIFPSLDRSWRDDPLKGLIDKVEADIRALPKQVEADIGGGELDLQPLEPVYPPRTLTETLQIWTERIGGRHGVGKLLIILDQFEEYFLYHSQEDGDNTFAVQFSDAVNCPNLRVNFLISMREDSLAKLDRFKGRISCLFENYLRIEHLDKESARSAIVEPVKEYNRRRAPGEKETAPPNDELVEAVLKQIVLKQIQVKATPTWETGGGGVVKPETLSENQIAAARIEAPYLQLVMSRLWREEMADGSCCLQLKTLEKKLGGTENIAREHLNTQMNSLSEPERNFAVEIFPHLVTSSGYKIAYPVFDLVKEKVKEKKLNPVKEKKLELELELELESILTSVLDKLTSGESRILRPVAPPPEKPDLKRYEIFHDVLAKPIQDWWTQNMKEKEIRRRIRRVKEIAVVAVVIGLILALKFQLLEAGETTEAVIG